MWRAGEWLSAIPRMLGRHPRGDYRIISKTGGISPGARTRSACSLTLAKRKEISRKLVVGTSMRQIALQLGRSTSAITREVARDGGSRRYQAHEAVATAWARARRPKARALAHNCRLHRLVAAKLKLQLTPVQMAGWLQREFQVNRSMQISHETIYRSLFIQARRALIKELVAHSRQARSTSPESQGRARIRQAVSISERPAEAEDRALPSHCKGDLLTARTTPTLPPWWNGTRAL